MKWLLSLVWVAWLAGFGIAFLGFTLKFGVLFLGTVALVLLWSFICEFFDKAGMVLKMFHWAARYWRKINE